MSIRRLTPVKPNGLKDKSRKQIFVGHLNLMTPQGPIPIQAPIDARNLKEAMEMYPGAIKIALNKMQEEVDKLKEKQESRIIVPGSWYEFYIKSIIENNFKKHQASDAQPFDLLAENLYKKSNA